MFWRFLVWEDGVSYKVELILSCYFYASVKKSFLFGLLETDNTVLEKYFLSDEVQKRLQITDPKFAKKMVW